MYNKTIASVLGGCALGIGLFSFTFGQKEVKTNIEKILFTGNSKSTGFPKDFTIQRTVPDSKRNLTFYYVEQSFDGLPILNGTATVVEKDGVFRKSGDRLITASTSNFSKSNGKSKAEILDLVWRQIDGSKSEKKTVLQKSKDSEVLINNHYSVNPIPVKEGIFYDGVNYRHVYDFSIEMKDHSKWLSIYADANTGEILMKNNWVVSCSAENCSIGAHLSGNETTSENHFLQMAPAPPPATDAYRVVAIPNISPVDGGFDLVVGPSYYPSSPWGWHDDNGQDGAEYTITRGNNVFAYEDADNNNQPGYSPDGGANLSFDFPVTSTDNPADYLDAAITNLFYMNNIMHDVYLQYGFDEPSGNFQANNYGHGGTGGDEVMAEAQDGSGTDNANFATPPEGSNPRMQMYVWNPITTTERLLMINAPNALAGRHATGKANFGPEVGNTPLTAQLVIAYDSTGNDMFDGCEQIISTNVAGKIAFVRKGGCDYDIKAANCEAAGAIGMLVLNTSLSATNMNVANPVAVNIPSLMLPNNPGNALLTQVKNGDYVSVTFHDHGWYGKTDSDFDNGIIAHEYGHGISNRLTGGASNTNCLYNAEQMGEGWSDWLGLMLTIKPTDIATQKRGVGTYVRNQENDGAGIRPRPYSTSFAINSYTYGATNSGNLSQPHGIGFVWATMLWDMNWALIDEYGYDTDLYNGDGGNNRAMNLVINGMKLQACNPGFVDGRDAILLADELLYNDVDKCLLWRVFAKRGLGANADQGDSDDRSDQIEDFSLPAFCTLGLNETEILEQSLRIFPNPTDDNITITMDEAGTISSVELFDLNGRKVKNIENLNTALVQVDLNDLKAGVYFVNVTSGSAVITKKIVKK